MKNMKNMKRVICWIITVMLVINMLPFAAFAADGAGQVNTDQTNTEQTNTTQNFTFEIEEVSVPTGTKEEVVVPVNIKNNPGFLGGQFYIEYDKNNLTLTEILLGDFSSEIYAPSLEEDTDTSSEEYTDTSKLVITSYVNSGFVMLDSTNEVNDDGELLILKFTINNSDQAGKYKISINPDRAGFELYNSKLDNLDCDVDSGSVTVGVAKIGEKTYTSIAEAIAAAKDGDTVTIFAGEFDPINISYKNITIQGTVGANGELLTTIKGGNPAITGHGFNGTIKDLKIVDAFKVMYAEPAGNVTVDNVYVTGATYGLHLVAYSNGLTWTIQNSYMDLSWANSFGTYGGGDAAIVVKSNEFASTNPYYPDYGALAVNTFLPNVTVEENIFGENVKIFIDDSVTDTSNIVVTKNYHADGVDKAFAVDEDGGLKVDIKQYYKNVDGNGNLTDLVTLFLTYEEFNEFVRNAAGGVYNGAGITVVLKDSERSYQNNKTAQFFIGATNVNITNPVETVKVSNVNFVFVDDVANNYLSGELQVFAKYIEFTNCTFNNVAVSPWGMSNSENPESAVFTDCEWNDLVGRYGVHQNRASNLTVTGCTFTDCERGIHTNSSTVSSITITGNTFTGIGDSYGVLCLAEGNGDLSNATLNISGNIAEGQTMLRQLSSTLTYDQVSAILDKTKNTYGTAYVYGSIEPAIPVAQIGSVKYVTLADALEAAQAGDTIELLADVTASEVILIGKSITINGNGHKVTSSATRIFRINANDIKVTFNDVEFVSTSVRAAGIDSIRGISIDSGFTGIELTLNNCSVDFTDATAIDCSYAVNVVGGSNYTVTVNGGTYEGANVINVWGTDHTIVVKNATLNSIYMDSEHYVGCCFRVEQDNVTVIAEGNTYRGRNAVAYSFIKEVALTASNNTDNTTQVVAKIGNTYYTSLEDALAAAQAGETVTILAGEYTENLNVNKSITVVGEGTVKFNGKLNITADNATVKNLSFNNGTSTAGYINAKNVTIDGCTVVGGNGFRYCYTSGTVTFKNSTITGSTYGIHFDGNCDGNVVIEKCVITGWTSFASTIDKVTISETEFANGNYNQLRFYQDAELTNVKFNPNMSIDFGKDEVSATFTGCSVTDGSSLLDVIYLADIVDMGINVTVNNAPINIVAKIGGDYYQTLDAAFAAAQNGDEVVILKAGTYALSTSGKNITITGAVAGIVFDNIGAHNMGGASVTFNNVTFDYYPNVNYTGLQHSGTLVYNNCTFNGQVFLYGASETFNNCTFNQNSADAYNVWTYGAKKVAFNECTFNSAGKSVLIYSEQSDLFNDVTVTKSTFNATSAVDGKAAIEMDSSHTAGIKLTIDAATTATGFGTGNVSGNSLWNNKKGNNTDANNDITVKVGDETVLAPETFVAKIGEIGYTTINEAIAAAKAGETVNVFAGTYTMPAMKAGITVEGIGDVLFEGTLTGTLENLTLKNIHIKGGNAQRWAYAKGDLVFENVTFEATSVYALHFDGITAGATLTYKNCTIIGWAAMSGSPASCVFEGCTFKGNGTYGLIRTYFDATIENCTFDVANVNTNDTYQDGIHAVSGATVTVNNCKNANGDMNAIVNVSGTSVVVLDDVEIKNVAKIGDKYYRTLAEAFAASKDGDTITLLADASMSEKFVVEGRVLTINGNGKLTFNDKLIVRGETTLNISCATVDEVILDNGAILKDSTINGKVFVAGKVIFRGKNTVTMVYDYGTLTDYYGTSANMEWTVEKGSSLTITDKSRYGLGYGDNITIYGSLTDALSARDTLSENDVALFMHGLVAQESNGWNCNSSMTVKDAYVIIGSNNSFGNKPGNYGGSYKFVFENVVLDASRITFYEALSQTAFALKNSDVKTGTFMIRDKDSIFTLTNTKMLSTTTFNGNDEGNYLAGTLVLINSELTYSASIVMEGGTIQMDIASVLNAPSITGNGTIIVDATGINGNAIQLINADMSGFTGTIQVVNAPAIAEITSTGLVIKQAAAKIGDTYYATLQAAIDACVAGNNTITLLGASAEDVTIKQTEGVNIVLDGANNTYSGTITIHGNARYNGAETLTIQNFQFTTDEAGHYFIDSNSTASAERYAHNVTVKDCKFTATGAGKDSAAAMRIRQGFNIAISNVESAGLHSVLQAYGNKGVEVTGLKITSGKNGISAGTSTGVVVKNANITVDGYGIRADGTGAYDLTVKNSEITANQPIIVRKNTVKGYTLTLEDNTLAGEYGVIITKGDDEEAYVTPEVSIDLYGVTNDVFPAYVAKIDNTYYATLEAAIAAQAGDTITLLTTYIVEKGEEVTIDLTGKTLVYSSAVAGEAMITNKGTLTLENGTVAYTYTGTATTSKAANAISNYGTLTIDETNVSNTTEANGQIGYAIDNFGVLTVNGGKITATGSNYYDGIRMFCASETVEVSVVVNGGEISSIWMQNASDGSSGKNMKDVLGSLTITNGKIENVWLEPSAKFEAAITGGYIGKVAYNETAEGRDLIGFISGGTFANEFANAFCAPGFIAMKNANNTWTVKAGVHGDVNGDSSVSVADVILLRQYVAKLDLSKPINVSMVDITGDGDVTVKDVVALRKLIVDANSNINS